MSIALFLKLGGMKLFMKNLINSFKENKNKLKEKLAKISTSIGIALMLGTSKVCAASGTESIDSFINFACDWLTKIRWSCSFSRWSYVCTRLAKRGRRAENQED